MRDAGVRVETGRFGARMQVELVNEGPVTIIVDSDDAGPAATRVTVFEPSRLNFMRTQRIWFTVYR